MQFSARVIAPRGPQQLLRLVQGQIVSFLFLCARKVENSLRIRVVVTVTRPRPRHCYPLSSNFITCQVDDVRRLEVARGITDGSWLSGVRGAVGPLF